MQQITFSHCSFLLHYSRRFVVVCLLYFVINHTWTFVPLIQAQTLADIQGLGAGRTGIATARGADALIINPANIAIRRHDSASAFSISLGGAGIAGTSALSLSDIRYFFGGDGTTPTGTTRARILSTDDRNRLLTLLDNSSLYAQTDGQILGITLGLPTGVLGFSFNGTAQSQGQIPRNLTQIARDYAGDSPLTIDNPSFNVYSAVNIQASYAVNLVPSAWQTSGIIRSLIIGASCKYIIGIAHGVIESGQLSITPFQPLNQDPRFTINSYAIQAQYSIRGAGLLQPDTFENISAPSPHFGRGFGVDAGATLQLALFGEATPAVTASIALTDVGTVDWRNGFTRSLANARDTIRDLQTIINNDGYFDKFNSLKQEQNSITYATALPTQLRLGGALDISALGFAPFRFSTQYTQGFNNIGTNSTTPRLGIGAEWTNTGLLPALRTGITLGGREGFAWTAGFGWNIPGTFAFDCALWSVNSLITPQTQAHIGAGIRIKVGA